MMWLTKLQKKKMNLLKCTLKLNGPIMDHQIMCKETLLTRYLSIKWTIGYARG